MSKIDILAAILAFLVLGGFVYAAKTLNDRTVTHVENGGNIRTVSHEGHWFVVYCGDGGGICHHPECPKCVR